MAVLQSVGVTPLAVAPAASYIGGRGSTEQPQGSNGFGLGPAGSCFCIDVPGSAVTVLLLLLLVVCRCCWTRALRTLMPWCWAAGRLLVLSWRQMHASWQQCCR